MLSLTHVRDYVIRPALAHLKLEAPNREQLILATGMQESRYRYLDQLDPAGRPGPGYGLWQMEKATHDDIWKNFIRYRPELLRLMPGLLIPTQDPCHQMRFNMIYAAAMCAVHYRRARHSIPDLGDINGMAVYWKTYYNTVKGAGTVEEFKKNTVSVFALK